MVETPTLRLVYTSPLQKYLVPQVTGSFENAMRVHNRFFDYTYKGQMNVLMHDLWHSGNAGARALPKNNVTVGIAPVSHDYESAPSPERMLSAMSHELAHIVTTDKPTASDRTFRRLFLGKVNTTADAPLSLAYAFLTTPRWFSPRWYVEGIATYLETWMNGGLGRAIGPYDEMVFRTLVRDSSTIYDFVGLESEGTAVDFLAGANSYLYGTRFMSYLALRYGNDSLLRWVDRREGSHRYFTAQFREVYGRSLEEEWTRWIAWEQEWQRSNLALIRQYATTATRPLTDRTLGAVSRAFVDSTNGSMLLAVRYPGQEAHIASIDIASGRFTRIANIVAAGGLSVTSLAFDPAARTLFYTTNNSDWRHLRALDLATGESRMLISNARIGDLAFNTADRTLWGVRHDNGLSSLVRMPAPYTKWDLVRTMPYGQDLFDIDLSPDGGSIAGSMSEVSGDTRLVRMNVAALIKGDTATEELFAFDQWAPSNFVYSRDGRYLYGSSYYSGVSNVFRYDLTRKRMEPLSNAETGFFKPVPLTGDSLIVFNYSGDGFVPSMISNAVADSVSSIRFLGNEIAERRPDVRDWALPPLADLGNESAVTAPRAYRSRNTFRLDNAYPIVEGYQSAAGVNTVAPGMRLNFSDHVGITNLFVSASYSPDQRLDAAVRLHVNSVFQHWNWTLTGSLNRADFYDLVGPTKMSRRGYSLGAQYADYLVYDGPTSLRYTLKAATNGNLAILPEFQNVATSFDRLSSFSGELAYKSLRRSIGAVEDELGSSWSASVRSNLVNGALYPRLNLEASKGFLLPLDHSSLWFRGAAGSALSGDRTQPFARFYFGGFANNWVDHRDIKQFRDAGSFPGLAINEVGGSTYAKAQVEWVSPPVRFQSIGAPSAYLRWANLSLFANGLVTDVHETAERRAFASAGVQVNLRLVTMSWIDSTISLGYAAAQGDGVPLNRAFMLSLKLM